MPASVARQHRTQPDLPGGAALSVTFEKPSLSSQAGSLHDLLSVLPPQVDVDLGGVQICMAKSLLELEG
ncbi:MAG: hypothetical protein HYU86_02745 [Chloroflexi bacterium]|nr:hypothetical protein [Chloroflexota bacterium]